MDRPLPDRVRLGQQLCLEPTALAGAASSTQTGSAIGAVCLNPILAGLGPGYAAWCVDGSRAEPNTVERWTVVGSCRLF